MRRRGRALPDGTCSDEEWALYTADLQVRVDAAIAAHHRAARHARMGLRRIMLTLEVQRRLPWWNVLGMWETDRELRRLLSTQEVYSQVVTNALVRVDAVLTEMVDATEVARRRDARIAETNSPD